MVSRLSWVWFALISSASFAGMGACVRMASETLPQSEVVFFRNFMALLFLLPLMLHRRVSFKTGVFPFHLLRSVTGLAAMYLYFYALYHLPLASALLLNYTSPLFVAMIAIVWLKEGSTRTRMLALIIGMFGVALLFNPASEIASVAGVLGLLSGAFAGLALATVKKLSATEPAIRTVTWFALLSGLISFVPMAFEFQWPGLSTWGWLLALGLLANMGQLGLTIAYGKAAATQVSPLGYSSLVFAGVLGFVVWGEYPDAIGLMGAALVVFAGVLVARERSGTVLAPPSAVPVKRPEGKA